MYWQIKYLDERNETVDGLINVLARQGILVQNDVTPSEVPLYPYEGQDLSVCRIRVGVRRG